MRRKRNLLRLLNPVQIPYWYKPHLICLQNSKPKLKVLLMKYSAQKLSFNLKLYPKLISGIELTSNGYKLAWSISEYLSSIQKSISETLKAELKEEPEKMPDTNNKEKKEPKAKQKVQAKTKAKPNKQQATSNK